MFPSGSNQNVAEGSKSPASSIKNSHAGPAPSSLRTAGKGKMCPTSTKHTAFAAHVLLIWPWCKTVPP